VLPADDDWQRPLDPGRTRAAPTSMQFGIASLAGKANSVRCCRLEDELAEGESDMPRL
jgi:hypothetical protein